jgi:cytochrome oxidase Cu insertion factor (SCO1/SenC/PrrC family)
MIRQQDKWPVGAAAFVLAVSVAWWGFALFTVPGAPEWLERARAVCFNLTETGLPDTKGWMLLLGQPPTMLLALYVGWSTEVRDTLTYLVGRRDGRRLLGTTFVFIVTGLALAGIRVVDAQLPEPTLDTGMAGGMEMEPGEPLPETYPRLDLAWPEMAGLVDQTGEAFGIEKLSGRNAYVTFAFGHCQTICPMVVHSARSARLELGAEMPIVVFTLDPWRDTPRRMPALVEQFELDPDRDFVVSGSVDAVNAALDALNMVRERDLKTGDIIHPALVYLVEGDGTIAYGSTGVQSYLVQLAERLR